MQFFSNFIIFFIKHNMLCLQAQKTLFLTQKTQYVVSSKNLQSISSAAIISTSKATKHSVLACNACTLPSKQRPVKARQVGDRRKACRLHHRRANSLHSIHKSQVAYEGHIAVAGYWCTLKIPYRRRFIQPAIRRPRPEVKGVTDTG